MHQELLENFLFSRYVVLFIAAVIIITAWIATGFNTFFCPHIYCSRRHPCRLKFIAKFVNKAISRLIRRDWRHGWRKCLRHTHQPHFHQSYKFFSEKGKRPYLELTPSPIWNYDYRRNCRKIRPVNRHIPLLQACLPRLTMPPIAHSTHSLPVLVALPTEIMSAYMPPQSPYSGC
jgi:hypothetical protein